MQDIDEKKFREMLSDFVQNGPRGTKARIAREANIARDTLDRILNGGAAYDTTIERIQAVMESSEPYTPVDKTEQDHWNVIADDLEALVRILRSGIDGDRKTQKFASTLSFYQPEVEGGAPLAKDKKK